jgi:hypothetical protein
MKLAIATLALATGLAFGHGSAAPAPDGAVETFIQLCGEPSGDATTALARADASSWKMPPKTIPRPPTLGGGVWSNLRARVKIEDRQIWVLTVGTLQGGDGSRTRSCGVVVRTTGSSQFLAMRSRLLDWVGVPPLPTHDTASLVAFGFINSADGHKSLRPSYDPLGNGARKVSGVVIVTLTSVMGVTEIIYQADAPAKRDWHGVEAIPAAEPASLRKGTSEGPLAGGNR